MGVARDTQPEEIPMLKFTYTPGHRLRAYRTTTTHVAPVRGTRALCGVAVIPPQDSMTEFRFGTLDGSLCTRCRNAVLKAEDETIFLGYDEKAVEPFVLLAYVRRNPEWAEPRGLATWRETLAESLARSDKGRFQNV